MGVVEEFYSVFGQRFAGFIKHRNGFAAGFFIEITLVGNPGAAGVFQAQRLGFSSDALDIITVFFIREMGANRHETALVQLCLEFFRRHSVGAGEFDIFDTPGFHFVERAGHIFFELLAQAVELEADRAFEAWSGARSGRSERNANEYKIYRNEQGEENRFHGD